MNNNRIRPLFIFQVTYELFMDEAMLKFKGRSSLKQYMPNKPIKRGIKVWVEADSIIGYVCDFSIYSGKDGIKTDDLGGKVVKQLASTLNSRHHHHLYFDNYFSSSQLFLGLLDMKVYMLVVHTDNRCSPGNKNNAITRSSKG